MFTPLSNRDNSSSNNNITKLAMVKPLENQRPREKEKMKNGTDLEEVFEDAGVDLGTPT